MVLAVLAYFATVVSAQQVGNHEVIRSFNEMEKIKKNLNPPTVEECVEPTKSQKIKDPFCEDLFQATCLDSDGSNKFSKKSIQFRDEVRVVVRDARNKASQATGYKDFDDALKKKLQDSSLTLKESFDPNSWLTLKRESNESSYFAASDASKLFAEIDACISERENAKKALGGWYLTEEGFSVAIAQYDIFHQKNTDILVKILSADMGVFVTSHLGNKCNTLKTNPAYKKLPENAILLERCNNFEKIKTQAFEIYRLEGTPEYQVRAEKFVRENLTPPLAYYSPSQPTHPKPTGNTALDTLIDQAWKKSQDLSICDSITDAASAIAPSVAAKLMEGMSDSRPVVETIVDRIYSPARKQKADFLFQEARKTISQLIPEFVSDPEKKKTILKEYDVLELYWMSKPKPDIYKKDPKTGLERLDESKLDLTNVDMGWQYFGDPSLDFFQTINAFYMPSFTVGKAKFDEHVYMLPSFLTLMDQNSDTFLAVVAHEAAHKIGPGLSVWNGYDLRNEYKDLLDCYRQNSSFKMVDSQTDETIADYFSSEVLAAYLKELPQDARKTTLTAALEFFCIFDAIESQGGAVNLAEDHPATLFRMNAIYGGNPNLRQAVGCEEESSKYKNCGLKGMVGK